MISRGLIPILRWSIPTVVLLLLIATVVNWWADTSRGQLPVLGELPDFEMIERNGQPFGKNDMIGQINIVEFFFTSCPGVCPVMNRNMSEMYRKLDGFDLVRFVSISVDPERDSLSALIDYADSIGVNDNRWVFLRAPVDDVVWLCEKGFMLPADGLPMGHTTRFALIDPLGRIRGYYDGMDEASMSILLKHLRLLAGERS